MLTNSSQT